MTLSQYQCITIHTHSITGTVLLWILIRSTSLKMMQPDWLKFKDILIMTQTVRDAKTIFLDT